MLIKLLMMLINSHSAVTEQTSLRFRISDGVILNSKFVSASLSDVVCVTASKCSNYRQFGTRFTA